VFGRPSIGDSHILTEETAVDALACLACGASEFATIEPPHPARSVTTAGLIVDRPLDRRHCLRCGLCWQPRPVVADKAAFYRQDYAAYFQRPGTDQSEASRYKTIAAWLREECRGLSPRSILDVGCGAGLLLAAMRQEFPRATLAGIDLSQENSALARAHGFTVVTGGVPGDLPEGPFDLIVAVNVIQHIADPIAFLSALVSAVEEDGRVMLLYPQGARVGNDLLWADQEFSFSRDQLAAVAARTGLIALPASRTAPPELGDKAVIALRRGNERRAEPLAAADQSSELLRQRREYFRNWRELRARLDRASAAASGPVYNFGASMWTMLLAGYCPEYWGRVAACIVDGASARFLDKDVWSAETLSQTQRPALILGTSPHSQPGLRRRFATTCDVVSWDDLIQS
jgi:SAM-dependent methyltransferase